MITQTKSIFNKIEKSNTTTTYEGRPVTVITVFSDIDIAMIEDENGNIMDVKNSLLRVSES